MSRQLPAISTFYCNKTNKHSPQLFSSAAQNTNLNSKLWGIKTDNKGNFSFPRTMVISLYYRSLVAIFFLNPFRRKNISLIVERIQDFSQGRGWGSRCTPTLGIQLPDFKPKRTRYEPVNYGVSNY